jgi:esterase/lipase superfamily enzyme
MNDRERRVFRENDGQTVTALKTLRRVVRMFAFAFAFETGGADAKKTTDREKTLDVFYAAHRDRIEEKGIGQPCEQADTLHYGWAKVSIPKGHQAGILETPWRAEDAESNEYVEKKFEFQFPDEEAFVKKINESIQVITPPQTVILQITLLLRTEGLRNT